MVTVGEMGEGSMAEDATNESWLELLDTANVADLVTLSIVAVSLGAVLLWHYCSVDRWLEECVSTGTPAPRPRARLGIRAE